MLVSLLLSLSHCHRPAVATADGFLVVLVYLPREKFENVRTNVINFNRQAKIPA
jgi:hypothetical protein